MKDNNQTLDMNKFKIIIERRLSHAPYEAKKTFPEVLKQDKIIWIAISNPYYLMIVFLSFDEEKRINGLIKKNLNPFPGLITTGTEGAAFKFENSKYITIRRCTVSNTFSFSLGKDSTIFLQDHTQIIDNKNLGHVEYIIPLAYILSYGDELNRATIYEYFEGLVAHSTTVWREEYG